MSDRTYRKLFWISIAFGLVCGIMFSGGCSGQVSLTASNDVFYPNQTENGLSDPAGSRAAENGFAGLGD
jgi:hypothetical protein